MILITVTAGAARNNERLTGDRDMRKLLALTIGLAVGISLALWTFTPASIQPFAAGGPPSAEYLDPGKLQHTLTIAEIF